jgi:hypothetical protein
MGQNNNEGKINLVQLVEIVPITINPIIQDKMAAGPAAEEASHAPNNQPEPMFPQSGGMSNYAQYSHGSLLGFIAAWANWVSLDKPDNPR